MELSGIPGMDLLGIIGIDLPELLIKLITKHQEQDLYYKQIVG